METYGDIRRYTETYGDIRRQTKTYKNVRKYRERHKGGVIMREALIEGSEVELASNNA